MASVYEVYTTLKDLANKDEKGMITPQQFNAFAGYAQTKVFNQMFTDLNGYKRLGLVDYSAVRPADKDKQILEDLAIFSKTATITGSQGSFTKPSDLARIISLSTMGDWILDQTTSERIQLVYDEEKMENILTSTLSVPTEDNPVALVSTDIQVFPTTIRKIKLRYYKTPEGVSPLDGSKTSSLPSFGYNVAANGSEVYDVVNSVDFELPDHYVPALVLEIAKMIGVNLRQADLYNYGQAEEQKNNQ